MQRRNLLVLFGTALALGFMPLSGSRAANDEPLHIGLTPAFLHDRHHLLLEWQHYLEDRLHRPVAFVLRDSYSDIMDLIRQGKLDMAWLSDYPYVLMKPYVRLLTTPLYHGRPFYRAYLIVPARDRNARSIADLKNKVFAYADPNSHTGFLAPRYTLQQLGADPDQFFRRTYFAWSHRTAIEAVARHLADGASVDGYVWESLALIEPDLTARTHVVSRSEEFGFPPIIVRNDLSEADAQTLRQALLAMDKDDEGRRILAQLHLTGFADARPELYDRVEEMAQRADARRHGNF